VANLHKIKKNLKAVSAIKAITATYREISQKEMKDIREKALRNREFIEKLSKMCTVARKSYLLEKEENGEDTVKGKKKTVSIFFSANSKFYGALVLAVWRDIPEFMKTTDNDLLIIGEVGKRLVEKNNPDKKFSYFQLDDERPSKEELKAIIDFIKKYDRIIAFHGRFKTILNQETGRTNISAESGDEEEEDVPSYLFEPSPEDILKFFEKELIAAFFNQAFLEHRLSRHATRMVAMHRAEENAKERREKLTREIKKIEKRTMDKKQLEIIIPYHLWK